MPTLVLEIIIAGHNAHAHTHLIKDARIFLVASVEAEPRTHGTWWQCRDRDVESRETAANTNQPRSQSALEQGDMACSGSDVRTACVRHAQKRAMAVRQQEKEAKGRR